MTGDGDRLDQLTDLIHIVAEGVADETAARNQAIAALRAHLDELAQRVTAPAPQSPVEAQPAPAGPPTTWTTIATKADWQDLATWVDRLNTTYELASDRRVHPCWPAHPGVVEELAAAHAAWTAAYRGPAAGIVAWHDDLNRLLSRLAAGSAIRNCADGHRTPGQAPATNTELLAKAAPR